MHDSWAVGTHNTRSIHSSAVLLKKRGRSKVAEGGDATEAEPSLTTTAKRTNEAKAQTEDNKGDEHSTTQDGESSVAMQKQRRRGKEKQESTAADAAGDHAAAVTSEAATDVGGESSPVETTELSGSVDEGQSSGGAKEKHGGKRVVPPWLLPARKLGKVSEAMLQDHGMEYKARVKTTGAPCPAMVQNIQYFF